MTKKTPQKNNEKSKKYSLIGLIIMIILLTFNSGQATQMLGRLSFNYSGSHSSAPDNNDDNDGECKNDKAAAYALTVAEEINGYIQESEDGYMGELNYSLEQLSLVFNKAEFNSLDTSALLETYSSNHVNLSSDDFQSKIDYINSVLSKNNCETYKQTLPKIKTYDFPSTIEKSKSVLSNMKYSYIDNIIATDEDDFEIFTVETDKYIRGTRLLSRNGGENQDALIKTPSLTLNLYKKESGKTIDQSKLYLKIPGYLDPDASKNSKTSRIQNYKGKTIHFIVGNIPEYGNIPASQAYLPEGNYYAIVEHNGSKYLAKNLTVTGSNSKSFCEILDTKISVAPLCASEDSCTNVPDEIVEKTPIQILKYIIENINANPDEDLSQELTYYEQQLFDHLVFQGLSTLYQYRYYGPLRSTGVLNLLIKAEVENECDLDLDTILEIKTNNAKLDTSNNFTIQSNSSTLDGNNKTITPLFKTNKELNLDLTEKNSELSLSQQSYNNSLLPKGDYLVNVQSNNKTRNSYALLQYKKNNDFKVVDNQTFYPSYNDLELTIEAKNEDDFNGNIYIHLAPGAAESDNKIRMKNGKATLTLHKAKSGSQTIWLESKDGTLSGYIDLIFIPQEIFTKADEILGPNPETCTLSIPMEEVITFAQNPMDIELPCPENLESLDLVLSGPFSPNNTHLRRSIYECTNPEDCQSSDTFAWNGLINNSIAPDGEYQLIAYFTINDEDLQLESETFFIQNLAIVEDRPFLDVAPYHPYFKAINWMANEGYIQGYADNTFRPESPVSRAELVKMIAEATGKIQTPQNLSSYFRDVTPYDWFFNYVANASFRKWVQGYPDGTFRPNQEITRAEAIKIAMVAHDMLPFMFEGEHPYADIHPNDWFYVYLVPALQQNLLGTAHMKHIQTNNAFNLNSTFFYPNQSITRAEVAEMLERMSHDNPVYPSAGYPNETYPNTGYQNNTQGETVFYY